MFDEGTNEVTINLPKQVQLHEESQKQINLPLDESKYDNSHASDEKLLDNFIDRELMNFAGSFDREVEGKYHLLLLIKLNYCKIFHASCRHT